MLDEIRAGQSLGAVLGTRFEKNLHEDNAVSADVEVCLALLRKTYPLPVTNLSDANPIEATIPNVVNGQAMLAYYLAHGRTLYPNVTNPSTAQKAVNAAAEVIALQMDAVADLLTAESVYQLAKGNMNAVNASAESSARLPTIGSEDRGRAGRRSRHIATGSPGFPEGTNVDDVEPTSPVGRASRRPLGRVHARQSVMDRDLYKKRCIDRSESTPFIGPRHVCPGSDCPVRNRPGDQA
jgi:hypothetical protein